MESVQLKNITVGRRVKENAEVLHCPSSCSTQFHRPGNKTETNKCTQYCSVTPHLNPKLCPWFCYQFSLK